MDGVILQQKMNDMIGPPPLLFVVVLLSYLDFFSIFVINIL